MAKIKDYTEEHPNDKFSGTDKPKENPFEVEPPTIDELLTHIGNKIGDPVNYLK